MKNGWILLLLVFLGACAHTAPQQEPEEAEASIEDLLNHFVPPDNINPVGCERVVYYKTDEQCRASAFCEVFGACASNGGPICIATSEADCKASQQCISEGHCTLRDGMCVLE
jgi:hypothetical protein